MTDAAATLERDTGIARALDRAERECPSWGDLALAFLRRYASRHATFVSEDVADAGREWGLIQPANDKAWGAVYVRAARAGIIRRVGYGISKRRHLSPTPLWQSQIYGGPK